MLFGLGCHYAVVWLPRQRVLGTATEAPDTTFAENLNIMPQRLQYPGVALAGAAKADDEALHAAISLSASSKSSGRLMSMLRSAGMGYLTWPGASKFPPSRIHSRLPTYTAPFGTSPPAA